MCIILANTAHIITIKTPNLVLTIVAVTFNTSRIQFIIRYLKANKA